MLNEQHVYKGRERFRIRFLDIMVANTQDILTRLIRSKVLQAQVAALARHGLEMLGSVAAPFDAELRQHPVNRCLHVRKCRG